MNGYPAYPCARLLTDEYTTGNVKWELHRVRANLNVPIEPTGYPFDRINLPVSIELLSHNCNISLVWFKPATGIDPDFRIVGWSNYPWRVEPRADMDSLMERNFY
jgi:hypothetical protein